MCKVYYPFFRLEVSGYKDKKQKKYNHRLYINILALFCDKILIPTWHLLEIDNDRFDILREYKILFTNGVIYSRIPEHMNTLEEYYENVKKQKGIRNPLALNIRIERIIKQLYEGVTVFEKFNAIEEQEYYSNKMRAFLQQYANSYPRTKGINKLVDFWPTEATIVSKEKFEPLLSQAADKKEISKSSFARIKKVSDELYFVAGASVQIMKVCDGEYFHDEQTKIILEDIIPNIDEIINDKYNPETIIDFLIKNEIIYSSEEIERLNVADIIKMRQQECFEKFIRHYERYSVSDKFDKLFEKKKNLFKLICRIKSLIISVGMLVLSTIITTNITSELGASIGLSLLFTIITYVVTYIWQTKSRYEIPLLEGLLDKIVGFFDFDSLYLAKLHWITRQNSVK